MSFTRTPGGLAEKWRFHQVPTIWVEGPTDIFFYEPITENLPCRMEAFHGCDNAKALIKSLIDHNYPYLVILDGDYNILKKARTPHPGVLVLVRYSFENFLWERDAVNRACLRHARCGDKKDLIETEMERVADHLKKELVHVVALDIAARKSPSPPKVLPDAIEQLASDNSGPYLDPAKIAAIVARVEPQLDAAQVSSASAEVKEFLADRCFTHLLKGHLILGILRRIFSRAAKNESATNSVLSSDALTQILAEMVWRRSKSDDHRRLKRAIRSKTTKLASSYPQHPRSIATAVP